MKTTVGALIDKITEIDITIQHLNMKGDSVSDTAVSHLEDYKEILWHTKVEV